MIPQYKWYYDAEEDAIMATTTTVVHTYFYLGHKVVEPNIPPAASVIPKASSAQPLASWDFPLLPLLDIEMEPTSPMCLLLRYYP